MLKFLDTVTSFIAPHECLACGHEGGLLCDFCIALLAQPVPRCYRCCRTDGGWATCKSCKKQSDLDAVQVATVYEGFAEAVVKKLKFERAYAAHKALARATLPLITLNSVIIPIPTANNRVRQRGYDQAVLISKELAKRSSSKCILGLKRLGNQRQTGSSRSDRKQQLVGAFEVRAKKLQGVERVILVDDILTTGATFEAAASVLKKSGVKHISAVAFARAE